MPLSMCLKCGALFRPKGQQAYCPLHAHLDTGRLGAKGRDWKLRNAVLARDGYQCTAILSDGSRCPEKKNLEVHHLVERRMGGKDTWENLTTVCFDHNPRGGQMRGIG
jgi:5-methylcytosine-specific restriction endonuclease McrA